MSEATGISICRVSAHNLVANAQLIAAAPDLLDALESILELREGINRGDYRVLNISSQVLQQAEKAIAKAKGETNE